MQCSQHYRTYTTLTRDLFPGVQPRCPFVCHPAYPKKPILSRRSSSYTSRTCSPRPPHSPVSTPRCRFGAVVVSFLSRLMLAISVQSPLLPSPTHGSIPPTSHLRAAAPKFFFHSSPAALPFPSLPSSRAVSSCCRSAGGCAAAVQKAHTTCIVPQSCDCFPAH